MILAAPSRNSRLLHDEGQRGSYAEQVILLPLHGQAVAGHREGVGDQSGLFFLRRLVDRQCGGHVLDDGARVDGQAAERTWR